MLIYQISLGKEWKKLQLHGDRSDVRDLQSRYGKEGAVIWQTIRKRSGLSTINGHIKKIFDDGELTKEVTVRKFRIVQTEGTRQVSRKEEV